MPKMENTKVRIDAYIHSNKATVYLDNNTKRKSKTHCTKNKTKLGHFTYTKTSPKTSIAKKLVKLYGNRCDVLTIHLNSSTEYKNLKNIQAGRTIIRPGKTKGKNSEKRWKGLLECIERHSCKVNFSPNGLPADGEVKSSKSAQKRAKKSRIRRDANQLFNDRQKEHYGRDTVEVDRKKVISRDKGICYLCGLPVLTNAHIDHILPIGVGPEGERNLACTHDYCNGDKSNKLPHELPDPQRFRLEKKWAELNSEPLEKYLN